MNQDSKLDSLARKFSSLYDEAPDEEECSPILSELKNINSRYTEKQKIASGGMKCISKVFDISTSRHLAMAELLPEIDEDFNEVFLREARLTALLEHPNIISIHDIGLNPDGSPYFTMDLKNGDTFEDILKELHAGNENYLQQYPLQNLLSIFIKICDAMAYAHSRDVIHLDLKPANIQIGNYGEVLVCDWGLGKIIGNYDTEDLEELLLDRDLLNNMTFNGQIKGTPGYMAPEQIEEDGEKDMITDIYSLGCILYSLVTFKRPFNGEVEDILRKTVNGDITPPKSINPQVPESLSAVIIRALSVDKKQRYQTVNELKNDLLKFQSGYSTHAEDAGIIKELSLFINRNRLACLISLCALIVILSMALYFISNLRTKTKVALNAQKIAENHQKRADFVAQQYKNERNSSERLVNRLSQRYFSEAKMLQSTFVYQHPVTSMDKAVSNLNKSLSLELETQKIKAELTYCYFVMQKFDEVIALENKEDERNQDLFVASRKYVDQREENGLLPIDKLAEMILTLNEGVKRTHLIEKVLAYDVDKRSGDHNYGKVVQAILKVWNPRWDMKGFHYNPASQKLEIKNPQVKILNYRPVRSSGLCILRFLKFNSLILAGSGIYDIGHIVDLKNQFLDIRHTPINSLKGIENLTQLKYLWIKKYQFSDKQLSYIPAGVKIVYK